MSTHRGRAPKPFACPALAGWMPVSWFGTGPGIPGSCFPSMGSMDGSMHGGSLFGQRAPPLGSPDGSVHGATLAQQARLARWLLGSIWLKSVVACTLTLCTATMCIAEPGVRCRPRKQPQFSQIVLRLQQASTGGDGSGHSGTLAMGALAPQPMLNGQLAHASSQVGYRPDRNYLRSVDQAWTFC